MDEKDLTKLYNWLDTIPFSRPKKNLARDFSDAVLVAELIKYFIPSIVDLHNYPTTNTLAKKKVNWYTLNRKVLRKLDFPLSDMTMNELAGAKREALEYFLSHLRKKIAAYTQKTFEKSTRNKETFPLIENLSTVDSIFESPMASEATTSSKIHKKESIEDNKYKWLFDYNSPTVPRETYEHTVQELLLAKEETIVNLKARIRDLEYLLLHKDHIINDLRVQLKESLQITNCRGSGDIKEKIKDSSPKA